MKKLYKSSRAGYGRNSHYHIVYINDDTSFGASSVALDHTHEVKYLEAQPASFDQFGNLVTMEKPAGWYLLPAPDGHDHTIEEYPVKISKKKENEDAALQDALALYKTAVELERDSIKGGRESICFYRGEQWEPQDKAYLQGLKRACLTINKTAKGIDELCGYQRQQRTDFRFLPVEGSDQINADILNVVVKNITNNCYYNREESKVFADVIKAGRGVFNIYVDRSQNIQGDIVIECFPWDGIRCGPHEKDDLSDCDYIFKERWYSINKIGQLWPHKVEEVRRAIKSTEEDSPDLESSDVHIQYSTDQYQASDNRLPAVLEQSTAQDPDLIDIAKKQVKVLECWRKVYEPALIVGNDDEDFYFRADGWARKDIEACGTIEGFFVVENIVQKIRVTKLTASCILSDENPATLPANDFFIVPVYCYRDEKGFYGKIENAKDPQREINKRRSLAADIGNKMAAYIWLYDDTTFPDPKAKQKFIDNSSSPGAILEVADTARPPKQVEGVRFPAEIVQLMQNDELNLQEVLNIQVLPGGANESGAAILQKSKQKLTGNEQIFDNLSFAKQKIGRLLIKVIQSIYTPARLARIINAENSRQPVQIGGQPVDEYTPEQLTELLENAQLDTCDVIISEADYSPSIRLGTAMVLMDLAKAGQPIPPDSIVNLLDLPEKQKSEILAQFQAQQQAQSQQGQEQSNTELDKTLVAQGIIPPRVKEYLNQSPQDQPAESPTPDQNQTEGGPNIPSGVST